MKHLLETIFISKVIFCGGAEVNTDKGQKNVTEYQTMIIEIPRASSYWGNCPIDSTNRSVTRR